MASGSNNEPRAASSDEGVSSPGLDPEVATAPGAGDDDAPAAVVSPPAAAPAAIARPYYECVFCKRGFTTAQALGGHMNIHRRDRAKPSRDAPAGGAASASHSRHVESYNQYQHLVPYPPGTTLTSGGGSGFAMYYRGTGAATTGALGGEAVSPSSVSPRELSLFGAAAHDLHLGLACHGRGGGGDGTPARAPEGSEQRQAGEAERELDLELRLGRRPRR